MSDTFDARLLSKSVITKLESRFTSYNGVMKGPVKININKETLDKIKGLNNEDE